MNQFRKLLPIIIVLLLIIGLPVISYYYLKSGYLFRKDALDKMQLNIAFSNNDLFVSDELKTQLDSKVQLIHFMDKAIQNNSLDQLNEVQDLFEESEKFALLTIGKSEVPDSKLQDFLNSSQNWYYLSNPSYLDTLSIFSKEKLLLVDTSGLGRAQYAFNDRELADLVKHITVLFPLKKRSKIKLQREQNNN